MQLRTVCLGIALVCAARAKPIPVQVSGIQGGFTIACAGDGCGGKFQAEIGAIPDSSGDLAGGTQAYVYCIDSQNSILIPSSVYEANLSSITAGSDLSNTRYGQTTAQWQAPSDPFLPIQFRTTTFTINGPDSFTPTTLQRYQMAAWIVDQYSVLPATDRTAIQDAAWQVMDVVPPSGEQAAGNYLQPPYPATNTRTGAEVRNLLSSSADFVKNRASDAFFAQFRVITNVGPVYIEGQEPAQEMIAIIATPEPASFAVAIGLILFSIICIRCRQFFHDRRRRA